jgi:hypothetical protein
MISVFFDTLLVLSPKQMDSENCTRRNVQAVDRAAGRISFWSETIPPGCLARYPA